MEVKGNQALPARRRSLFGGLSISVAVMLTCVSNTWARGAGMDSELYGIRLKGEAEALSEVERVAAPAGWSKTLHESPTSLVLLAPPDYSIERFRKLIEALGHVKNKKFGLQLLGPGGRAVGPDGHYIDEK